MGFFILLYLYKIWLFGFFGVDLGGNRKIFKVEVEKSIFWIFVNVNLMNFLVFIIFVVLWLW